MGKLVAKLVKALAYTVAGFVILLAIGVGLLRLFLPRLPEYQEQIKAWAGDAIGVRVEFSAMDARWGLDGPELEFIDAELNRIADGKRIVAADKVSISVAMLKLLTERTVAVDRILVSSSTLDVYREADGSWIVQGDRLSDLLPAGGARKAPAGGDIEFVGEDIELRYRAAGEQRPTLFDIDNVTFSQDEARIAVSADIALPESLGRGIEFNAMSLIGQPADRRLWDITAQFDDLDLAGVSGLLGLPQFRVASGRGDIDLALAVSPAGPQSAAVTLDLEEVSREGMPAVSLQSDLEYRRDDDGWLLAANRLRLSTASGSWPESSFRIDVGLGTDEQLVSIDASADYLNLADLALFSPLFDEQSRTLMETLAPRGELRNLDATITGLGTDTPGYSLSAGLGAVGFDRWQAVPGLRRISGQLRADDSGGRLLLASSGVEVLLDRFLSRPVELDTLNGTVIWRRSGDSVTVLSDNISLTGSGLTADTNVQLVFRDGASPEIDLASRWAVSDISAVKRYIPEKIMHPNLYRWFQDALQSGRIENGRVSLTGPLDAYPFDNDEGRFLLEGTVVDSVFKYLPQWPANTIRSMDVVLDNTRLYTEKNDSVAEGRIIRDAQVEIADLRDGILTIEGVSSGDMQSLVAYAKNSPIAKLLGGGLDLVAVEGNADTELSLTVPLKNWREFEFLAAVDARDATVRIDGLRPAFTGVNGRLEIEREAIRARKLSATFLGDTIDIELQRAREDMNGYAVVATATGRVAADRLIEQFGLPAQGRLTGVTDYQATALFPDGKAGKPFAIGIASDLTGFAVDLPAPFGKAAGEERTMQGDIRLVEGTIESRGRTRDIAWNLLFLNDGGVQFERGTLALGEDGNAPDAETRGLHIVGNAPRFDLDEWLAMRQPGQQNNIVANIRSAEVTIGELSLLGQRYADHWLRLDRSARDWLIQVRGELAEGTITLPYEFSADTTLVMEMQKLVLPGDGKEDEAGEPGGVDPRTLPSITLAAGEFALGERHFGAVEAELRRSQSGMVAERIIATDDAFEIVATGSWAADGTDPSGFRTAVTGNLRSSDIKQTMRRLNYQPGINGKELSVIFDVDWSGGPGDDFLASIDGDVKVQFGPGQLDEIDPGAGRVVGLLSVVALPRRLSLDFSDVFQKGFAFDSIVGDFRLEDGDTYTCNLSLEGPAATIAIVGRAGLATEDYEQAAVVSANFGNSLPVGAAIVAGPQAAVAALILSQIFKEPLQELTQVYYDIGGSFDAPAMTSADASVFAEKGRLAGCVEAKQD